MLTPKGALGLHGGWTLGQGARVPHGPRARLCAHFGNCRFSSLANYLLAMALKLSTLINQPEI